MNDVAVFAQVCELGRDILGSDWVVGRGKVIGDVENGQGRVLAQLIENVGLARRAGRGAAGSGGDEQSLGSGKQFGLVEGCE